MRIPRATYRVQLNERFGFSRARDLLPYLKQLGISDVYLSPILQARKGSTHGYDATDPSRLNPDLGSPAEWDSLVSALRRNEMGLLVDIVPNHMAASTENPWWMDVLENGSASPYAAYFDVEWEHRSPSVHEKLYLPVLGEPYGTLLEKGELQLHLSEAGLQVDYASLRLPIDPATWGGLLTYRLDEFLDEHGADPSVREYGLLLELAESLPSRDATEWEALEVRRRDAAKLKANLPALYETRPEVREFLDENVRRFNGTPGDPASFDHLDKLLDRQPYQLAFWRIARERINYRRFFDVNELIGIRAQDPQVFEAVHEQVFRLFESGEITGLRIDHVDGLYDPLAYLARLQARASSLKREPTYIVVEKILCEEEKLPDEWPVAGTTGYDFLGAVNNVFVHPDGLARLDAVYQTFTGERQDFAEIAYQQKKRIMDQLFAGELLTLGFHLAELAGTDRHARDLGHHDLRVSLIELTASMPVYRTYTRDFHTGSHDRAFLDRALSDARRRNPSLNPALFDFLDRVFQFGVQDRERALRFIMRWQQISGPIMAKGVEDTTLYVYTRLLSMNDVGGSPEPVSSARFHEFQKHRQEHWPGSMNATSTHDTKRGEDVRARLNVLSEMPDAWGRAVNRWSRWNRPKRVLVDGKTVPSPNEEYLLYQTLLGAWPLTRDQPGFVERIGTYMRKALREAKRHTSWTEPNEAYENAVLQFVEAILRPDAANEFLLRFQEFGKRLAFFGAVNSLSQTTLKMTCPGVPDFYQGTGAWDLRLVDPDNREPDTSSLFATGSPTDLLKNWESGAVKQFLIQRVLGFRATAQDLFDKGEYVALETNGNVLAFARTRSEKWMVTVVPRFITGMTALEKWPIGRRFWRDACVSLPVNSGAWTNVITGQSIFSEANGALLVGDALREFPVAVLTNPVL